MFNICLILEMPGKNKYYRPSKISEAKFRHLLRLFAMELTATDVAQLCGLSVRSVNAVYQRILVRLAQECAVQSPFSGELKADEFYFAPKRIRGKRGRGAGGKTIVFGLLKRGDCVYTEIAPKCFQSHATSHHPRQNGPQQHYPHRWLAWLRWPG